jgi:hypothetical protein
MITGTYYPTDGNPIEKARADIAMRTITKAVDNGIPVTLVDSGSHASNLDLDALEQLPGVTVIRSETSDMVENRQEAARKALKNPAITHVVWNEPEKDISHMFAGWARRMVLERADVMVPMRNDTSSYPATQAASEFQGNRELQQRFGGQDVGDHYMGTRMFTRDATTKHFLRPYEQYGTDKRMWGSIFAPVFAAMVAGDRVVGLPVDFEYPLTQLLPEQGGGVDLHHLQQLEAWNDPEAPSPFAVDEETLAAMGKKRQDQRDFINEVADAVLENIEPGTWNFRLLDGYSLDTQRRSFDKALDLSQRPDFPRGQIPEGMVLG